MRIGIVGAGKIVPEFLAAQDGIEGLTVGSIYARDAGKAEAMARAHAIPAWFCNYEEMLDQADIDAVYIAVPNGLHYPFAKQALLADKHVVCEKPFCANEREAEALASIAISRKLYLMEAISNQYLPNYDKVRELLPGLGGIKSATLNYSQYSSRYAAFQLGEVLPVFDPKLSGGALMDLNVYNIHFLLGLFGSPERVFYDASIENGIDVSGVLHLEYSGFKAAAFAAKNCDLPPSIHIRGERAAIRSDSYPHSFQHFCRVDHAGGLKRFDLNGAVHRLYHELRRITKIITEGLWQEHLRRLEQTLAVQRVLDEARETAGIEIQYQSL